MYVNGFLTYNCNPAVPLVVSDAMNTKAYNTSTIIMILGSLGINSQREKPHYHFPSQDSLMSLIHFPLSR